MFTLAQRTIDHHQNKIGILRRFSGDGNVISAVNFANSRRVDQCDFIVVRPRDFVASDRRTATDIGGKSISARKQIQHR